MTENRNETLESKVVGGAYDISNLNSLWLKAKDAHNKKDKIFKVIDAVDNGEQWSIYNRKIRKSQSLPVSNILSSIRDTRHGALNVNGFVGEFTSESELMDPVAVSLTDYMTHAWRKGNFDETTDMALENMLTFGTGITMVSGKGTEGAHGENWSIADDIVLTNIEPSSLYPDPGAKDESQASYYFIKDSATTEYLRTIPMFKEAVDANISTIRNNVKTTDSGVQKLNSDYVNRNQDTTESDFIMYIGKVIMEDGKERWDVLWMFGGVILKVVEGIKPNKNPLVFLREKRDRNSFWGQSTYKQNLALQLSINEIDSAIITHTKSQQDPVTMVNTSSGINVADYAKNKDNPGRVFPFSTGSASEVVQFVNKPDLPNDIISMPTSLIERIKDMTGVGDIASGMGSGSLQTAGGISQILQRAGLKDTKVIKHIQSYLFDLYSLIIERLKPATNVVRYAVKDHVEQDMAYKQLDLSIIDWTKIALIVDVFNHTGSAKEANRQTISELFQQSVQYSAAQPITEPSIMTADEYLQGIKEPNLHNIINQIMERRKRERELDMSEKVAQIIQIYLQLVSEGMNPQEAIITVAQEFATDPGLLKGFTVAEMAQQQQQAQAGSAEGSNQHQNTGSGN